MKRYILNRKSLWVWILLMGGIIAVSAQNVTRPKIACPNGIYVNSYNGVLFYQRSDLRIPNRSLPLEAIFYYNSSSNTTNYGYGNGWSMGMEMRYIPDTAGIIIEQGDGRQDLYARFGSQFDAPAGVFNTLTMVGNGYELRTKGGTRYFFTDTVSKCITRIEDRNNNALNLSYTNGFLTAISDDNGRALQFSWTDSLMTRMTTSFDNRSWSYQYDENGNLAHVTDAMQRTVHYGYNSDNRISVFTDAAGYSTYVTYNGDGMAHRIKTDLTDKSIRYEQALKQTVFIDYLTDGNNQFSTYYFDDEGRVIEKKGNCCGYSSKLQYDNDNNVTRIEDANGHVTTYTYDHNGNVLSETNALGYTQYYTYEDTYSNILSYTDPKGNVYHFSYDDRGNLTEIRNPLNATNTYTYNNYGQVLTTTDANGNVTTCGYDNYGNLVYHTDALGNTNTLTYNVSGNLISAKDPYQGETHITYNNANEIIRLVDPLGNAVQMSYDQRGALATSTDAKQQVTHFTYDALRQPISITGPLNNVVTTTYNAKQKPVEVVDAMNNAVKYVYNDHDWLICTVDVLGDTTWYSYDNIGKVIGIQMPNGQTLSFQYDALDRLIATSDRMGTTAQFVYDATGNVVESIDGEGNHTYYTYDAMDRLTQITNANGGISQYTYDANGNPLSLTDANGHTTTFVYDALNRQISCTDALGNTTAKTYNANGKLTSVTDAKGQTTSYTYDANGQLIQIAFADGKTQSFEYDGNGNMIRQKDEAGRYTMFAYDALNRLTTKTYPDNSTYQYTYDLNGNMLTANNADAQVSFSYDNGGRVLSETLNGKTTSYAYNTKNRVVTKTYPSGRTIIEEYDYRQRMTGIKENDDYVATMDFNANNLMIQRSYGNGITISFVYNALNQLTQLTDNSNIANIQMAYDAVGNMISKKDQLRPTRSEVYGYDVLNRLTSFKKGEISVGEEIPNALKQIQYVMDALGNRTTETTDGVTTNYTTNNMNAYTSITGGQDITPQYDEIGNMTSDGTHTYQYNYSNSLKSVDNGQTATYKFDALGRRIQKMVSSSGSTTNYYYSGAQVVEERNASDEVLATYIFGVTMDDVLQMQRDGNTFYYHKNHLGSVTALTDGSGDLVEHYEYDPYGQPSFFDASNNTLNQSAAGNAILFTGRDYDAETGLYFYRARTMHPGLGRFMQHDPLLYVNGLNIYSYAKNMPTLFIDPRGTDVFLIVWTTGTAGAEVGHAAIAISNNDAYSFYDNWPGEVTYFLHPLHLRDAKKEKKADRNEGVIINDIEDFVNNYPNYFRGDSKSIDGPSERVAPNAVLRLSTTKEEDEMIIKELNRMNEEDKIYSGQYFNCSTYVSLALEAAFNEELGVEHIIWQQYAVTPNQLWKDVISMAKERSIDCTILKNPNGAENVPFLH